MRRKLKIDLHTHCSEAAGFVGPDIKVVSRIVEQAKARGLDGLAVTEHWDASFGWVVKNVVEEHFADAGLVIVPGREMTAGYTHHLVELRLPNGTTFKFLAHPNRSVELVDGMRGIEILNGMHDDLNQDLVLELARAHHLVLLSNSDAHRLEDIGRYHTEVTIDDETGEWLIADTTGQLVKIT